MANSYESIDYGTVSGQSTGFRGGPVRDDVEFSTLQNRLGAVTMEINQQTHTLRQLYQQIGTSSDSDRVRGRIQMILRSTVEKVQGTRADLEQLVHIQRNGDPGQRLAAKSLHQQVQKSGNDFNALSQNILERLQEYREPPRSQGSLSHGYLDSGELEVTDDSARLLRSPAKEDVQQQIMVSSEARFAEERAERMEELQADIGQLNEIMGEIGLMVVEQGEKIDAIETHVESGYSNVRQGNVQLEQAVRYKKCSRKLCCCILCILLLVLIVIGIIVGIVVGVVKK